jgi:hypothetical protein
MRVSQHANATIDVGLFDFAETMVDPPTDDDIAQLAKAIPYMIGDLMADTQLELPKFQHFVDIIGVNNLSQYVTRSYRALLALQDYMRGLSISDILEVTKSALSIPDLHPQLSRSLNASITQVTQHYLHTATPVPWLANLYFNTVGKMAPSLQLAVAIVRDPMPERPFARYSKNHLQNIVQQVPPNIRIIISTTPEFDPATGVPTWHVEGFVEGPHNTRSFGSAKLWGAPLVCVSPDPERSQLNLFQVTGAFNDFVQLVNRSEIQDVCTLLPPTKNAIFLRNVQEGAVMGVFRGFANVTEWSLATKTSATFAWGAGKVLFYGSYCYAEYYQNLTDPSDWLTPAAQALTKTATLAAVDVGLSLTSNICGWLSRKASESNIPVAPGFFGFFSRHVGKGAFVVPTVTQGPAAVLASLGAGMLVETVIEHSANKMGIKAKTP